MKAYFYFETASFLCFRWYLFMVSVPKPYVFGSETVRFWDGERKRETA